MADQPRAGIYLIVEFDWPRPFENEHGRLAAALHQATLEHDWVREVVTASGGLGGELSSIWIFWLPNYAALDRLLKDERDPVSRAFNNFFSHMAAVHDRIREEVIFMSG